jgi:putative peptide zinc metalloprotease protein
MKGSIFSEMWYKVSSLRVSLNTNSYIKKQIYRGSVWYVIEDKYNNQFFKMTPEAYEFVARLSVDKSVEEVWEESLLVAPQTTPSQDDVIALLTSLHHKNLLFFKNRANNEQLLQRSEKKDKQKLKSKLLSFLYIKIPLFDPDNWLDRAKPFIDVVFSKKGFIIWLLSMLIALIYVVQNFNQLYDMGQGILAPSKLFLLYVSIVILKTLHEFGHAMMVKKFGGKVNTMGVMILILTPIPYMDATQSWLFRSKYQRVLVGGAGMMIELFIASICTIIWANTGDGTINSICFNMMVIGSISSLFFNGNPLLRFDSYFMLSDYLEIPNLYEKSKKECFYLVQHYIFRMKDLIEPSSSKKEAFWMVTYAIASFVYRLLVAIAIALFVADEWFFLGVLVFVISIYMWVLKPIIDFFKYIFTNSDIKRVKKRVYYIVGSLVLFLFVVVFVVRFPFAIKANGIVIENNYKDIYLDTNGFLKQIYAQEGEYVKKGDTLIAFENFEIDAEIKKIKASIEETKAYKIKAKTNSKADVSSINEHLKLLEDRLNYMIEKRDSLVLKADKDGYFVYSDIKNKNGKWFTQGTKLGAIIPNGEVHFQAVVPQEEAFNIFASKIEGGSLKLYGIESETIDVSKMTIIPYQKQELPSAVLGWLGGGDMAVSQQDNTGRKTSENFFEIRADLVKRDDINFYQARSGLLKVELEPKTLADRVVVFVKQVLQKHYKI